MLASQALALHLVDRLGYLHDAIAEAEQLSGIAGAEVVLFHRIGLSRPILSMPSHRRPPR